MLSHSDFGIHVSGIFTNKILECSAEISLFLFIVVDEEPIATSGIPTSAGAKSTGTTIRVENQGPAPGGPQTPPAASSPLVRYVN